MLLLLLMIHVVSFNFVFFVLLFKTFLEAQIYYCRYFLLYTFFFVNFSNNLNFLKRRENHVVAFCSSILCPEIFRTKNRIFFYNEIKVRVLFFFSFYIQFKHYFLLFFTLYYRFYLFCFSDATMLLYSIHSLCTLYCVDCMSVYLCARKKETKSFPFFKKRFPLSNARQ